MDELSCIVKNARITLRLGEVLIWADHTDPSPDPDVALSIDALYELLDLALYLREPEEEDLHA